MYDFIILKKFHVNIHLPKAPIIKEVIWIPPISNCTKCNTSGASTSYDSSYEDIFQK